MKTRKRLKTTLFTGQKGGVGKTSSAKAFVDFLDRHGINWLGMDLDGANHSFAALGDPRISAIDLVGHGGIRDETAVTRFATDIYDHTEAGKTDLLVADLGAGQLDLVKSALQETGLTALCGESLDLFIFYVVVGTRDSLSTLHHAQDSFDGVKGARWVIIRNDHDGSFAEFETSKTRKAMLDRGAIEMTMPLVRDPEAMAAWSRSRLSLSAFNDPASGMPFGIRGRMASWAHAMHEGFARTGIA